MKIIKKLCALFLTAAFCITVGTMSANNAVIAKAETSQPVAAASVNDEIAPAGWITNITINLNADSTYVWVEAKNDFTFPMATVYTIVRLYSSENFTEDISKMTLEAQNSIADLDMGSTLIAKRAINGRQLYWHAEVRYQMDGGSWEIMETPTFLISANGTVIG